MGDFVASLEPENTKYTTYNFVNSPSFLNGGEIQATSICSKDNLIFIGTNNGVVYQLMFMEVIDHGFTRFCCYEILSKSLFNKSINKICCCSKSDVLAVSSEDNLLVCNAELMEILNFNPQFKCVTSFHLSVHESTNKLAITFKSSIVQLYHITLTNSVLVFEYKLSTIPQNVCVSSQYLCIALLNSYISIHLKTKVVTELLQFDKEKLCPLICHVTQNEFMVLGPSSLAVIVDANGSSHRAPLQLSSNILDVFVWRNYLFTLTDEFFTIHNILTQKQLQTVLVKSPPVGVCFSTDSHLLLLITGSRSSSSSSSLTTTTAGADKILAIGPERWDVIARGLILAKCIKQASQLLTKEEQRVNKLAQMTPDVYKNEKSLFIMRRQRLHGVLGFHYFEIGAFQQAATHFEKSLMDIRELLYRYNDLLPKGYYFKPSWFYRLHLINYSPDTINDESGDACATGINLVSDLCVLKASEEAAHETDLSSTSTWLLNYQKFLFNFLCKHHKSKFVEPHLQFVETALVKLHVNLEQFGLTPHIHKVKPNISEMNVYLVENQEYLYNQDLFTLISNLIHIDVDDLNVYLEKIQAWHALAIILHWQGNLTSALDIWQKLVYGELEDKTFPGKQFYISMLSNLSAATSTESMKQSDSSSTNDFKYETPVYADLVWNHFQTALIHKHDDVVEQLLLKFPIPSNYSEQTSNTISNISDTIGGGLNNHKLQQIDSSLAPSQLLSPTNLIKSVYPDYPKLARFYLKYLCDLFPNKHAENHHLLANVYLDNILTGLDDRDNTNELKNLRREFRQFLRGSKFIPHKELIAHLQTLPQSVCKKISYEFALLEGKSGNHEKALQRLLIDDDDLMTGLDYCLSLVIDEQQQHHNEQICIYDYVKDQNQLTENLFTIFIKLCLQKNHPTYFSLVLELLNNPEVVFDFTDILSTLPPESNVKQIRQFLRKSIRIQLQLLSTLIIQYGLIKHEAQIILDQLPTTTTNMLLMTDEQKCAVCTQAINTYGSCGGFVWLMRTNELLHRHCYSKL